MTRVVCWLSYVVALAYISSEVLAQRGWNLVSVLIPVIHHIFTHFIAYDNQFHETRIEDVAIISLWLLRPLELVDNKDKSVTIVEDRLSHLCCPEWDFVDPGGVR